MKDLRFSTQATVSTERDLVQLEGAIGARLPSSYRQFLLTSGGGLLQNEDSVRAFPIASPALQQVFASDKFILDEIYGASAEAGKPSSLERLLRTLAGRIPPRMIAIASNAMGDHVLLHLDSGDVYIWDHEGEEFENPRRMTNVYPQGTGFDELLAELSVYE